MQGDMRQGRADAAAGAAPRARAPSDVLRKVAAATREAAEAGGDAARPERRRRMEGGQTSGTGPAMPGERPASRT